MFWKKDINKKNFKDHLKKKRPKDYINQKSKILWSKYTINLNKKSNERMILIKKKEILRNTLTKKLEEKTPLTKKKKSKTLRIKYIINPF